MIPSSFSLAPVTQFFLDNPGLRAAQLGLIVFGIIVLFLLFYALRDILLRTHSFWYQFLCIVIVTLFPIVGFLVYLLIRPARTVKQREMEAMLLMLLHEESQHGSHHDEHAHAADGKKENKKDDQEVSATSQA